MTDHVTYVLGAGFSRAIADDLPLADELGNLVVADVSDGLHQGGPRPVFSNGSFETWLSSLAEDQPYLGEAENLENAADFVRVARSIHRVITERQHVVLSGSAPDWLVRFLAVAHEQRATLISFNYDTLVEHGVGAAHLYDWNDKNFAHWFSTLENRPPAPRSGGFGPTFTDSFRLLKLHGSLNWYWVPGDNTGATLARWDIGKGWGRGNSQDEAMFRRMLPGRDPFIVPPSAVKSAYYRNPITRQLWRDAATALSESVRVALVGYSIPETDIVTGAMLRRGLQPEAMIDVVNPEPEPVTARLDRLGIEPVTINEVGGPEAVLQWSDDLVDDASRRLKAAVLEADAPEETPLVVAWASERVGAAVIDVRPSERNGRVEVRTEPFDVSGGAYRARHGSSPVPVHFRRLRQVLVRAGAGAIISLIHERGGTERSEPIISHAISSPGTGHRQDWLVLRPALSPGPLGLT